MPRFNVLSMTPDEAMKLAEDAELAQAKSVDYCLESLEDIRGGVRWLIPDFSLTQRAFGSLITRLCDEAKLSNGARRIHIAIILMAFSEDSGLAIILQALEGTNEELRGEAIVQLSYSVGQKWPVHYYEKILGSCQIVLEKVPGRELEDLNRFCFAQPGYRVQLFQSSIPVISAFVRRYLDEAKDYKRRLAATWFLCQGKDDGACQYVDDFISAKFSSEMSAGREWLKAATDVLRALKGYCVNTQLVEEKNWSIQSSILVVEQISILTAKPGMPHIKSYWDDIATAFYGVAVADFPKAGAALLRDIVINRLPGEWIQERALASYAYLAGAVAVDDLLNYMLTVSLRSQGMVARTLMVIAPNSRYLELAIHLRKIFEENHLQLEYGEFYDQGEQEGLGGIACALALFDSNAATAIAERFVEFGQLYGREVFWAINSYTPLHIATMLIHAQAMEPILDWMPHHLETSAYLLRNLLGNQLAILKNDNSVGWAGNRVLNILANVARPPLVIEGLFEGENGELRFVYDDKVFEISMDDPEDFTEVAECFNIFLCHIKHPQRVFYIDGDGAEDDGEICAFICANETLFSDVVQKLNYPIRLASPRSSCASEKSIS